MNKQHTSQRIKFGLLTLALGSLLGVIALLMRGQVPLAQLDVDAWAKSVTGEWYIFAQVLYIFAYVIPFWGFWALYGWLSTNDRVERLAFWGFLGSIVGTSLALPMLGIFSFVSPLIAQLYLGGDSQIPEVLSQVSSGIPLMVNLAGGVLYLVGTGLLGLAVWRSGFMPKWAGLLIGLHGLFLVFGFTFYPLLLLGWVFLVVSGFWLFNQAGK
jgi:hypothetical protein